MRCEASTNGRRAANQSLVMHPARGCKGQCRPHILRNMKTIAVTVDEATLVLLDDLAKARSGRHTRSAVVRAAVRELAARERQREVEAEEREILRKHRKHLDRAARALVDAQARS